MYIQTPWAIEGGVVLVCSNCDHNLTERDVHSDREFCKKNGLPDPPVDGLLCRRKDCRANRKKQATEEIKEFKTNNDRGENAFTDGKEIKRLEGVGDLILTGTRRTEDGYVRPEKPIVEVALTKYDLMDDEGKLRRSPRTDHQILQSLLDRHSFESSCERHRTPGCRPCRSLQEAYKKASENAAADAGAGKQAHSEQAPAVIQPAQSPSIETLPDEFAGWPELDSIKNEVDKIIDARPKRIRKRKSEPKVLISLRNKYRYTLRELAACFDEPGFNAKVQTSDLRLLYTNDIPPGWTNKSWRQLHLEIINGERYQNDKPPRTMEEILNMLPMRWMPIFSSGQVQFYKEFASGNYTLEELEQRIVDGLYFRRGFEEKDHLVLLENKIIKRAWDRLLLPIPDDGHYHHKDFDVLLDEADDARIRGIDAGAETINGSIIGMKHKKMWGWGSRASLNDFDNINGKITERRVGDDSFDSSMGVGSDDYGEESMV